MASKKGGKCKRSYYQAKLVTNVGTCVFCQRAVDDEIIYGKLYAIGDIQCHYFCALLSCCLIQKGSDEEGLFGFLYHDILAEVERSKKHRCSYCNRDGASLGCSVAQCRKQFHLPCGRERDAVSLFYGNYKTFCANHAPKQKILDSIMPNVKLRISQHRRQKGGQKLDLKSGEDGDQTMPEVLCVICYEEVEGFPTSRTFWPPCCARDAWFHRSCLQRMALSAGMHYLKCPLCNDKDEFYKAVVSQGYYVPDRDAAWELEQNAFAEIYERPVVCSAEVCKCGQGRDYDSDSGVWDIKLCILCGSTAIHAGCVAGTDEQTNIYICSICKPAAPCDLETLIASIEKVQLQEQVSETVRHGPVMPSRMSIRRTKPRLNTGPGSSRNFIQDQSITNSDNAKIKTEVSREELNLKKPVRRIFEQPGKNIENILLSPIKMLEQGLTEKIGQHGDVVVDSSEVLEKLREKLKKPRPLEVKKKIISHILDELFANILHDPKSKEALKEWNSPKKMFNVASEDKEITEDITPTITVPEEKPIIVKDIKPKSVKPISLQYTISNDKEDIHENNEFKCNFKHKHIENTTDGSKLRTAIDFAIDAHKEKKRKIPPEETLPIKKRKYNCSLIKKERKESENNGEIANTELNTVEEVEDVIADSIENGVITNENEVRKDQVKIAPLKIVIDCSPKKASDKKMGEKAEELEMEDGKCDVAETKNTEDVILKEDTVDLREVKIEAIDEKTSIVDENLKLHKDIVPRKKNCGSKKKSRRLVEKSMNVENDTCDLAKTKRNMELENVKELKENIEEFSIDRKAEKIRDRDIKRRKTEKKRSKNKNHEERRRKERSVDKKSGNEVIDFSLDDKEKKLKLKYKDKHKKKLSIQNKDIKVKIKWKKEHFKLKITGKKETKKKRLETPKVFKQYVLKYSPEVTSPRDMIMKPDNDITPVKRKYIKTEKHCDNMKQTNISSFFKATPKAS